MAKAARPHVLGIDDGPFEKRQREPVAIVGVMMEGPDLVEALAVTEFPVDGEGATEFLADWVAGLRLSPTLQGIVLGGITIAGLGVVDVEALSHALAVPILVVTRRDPANHRLHDALRAAGLADRLEIVERTPKALPARPGLYLARAGIEREGAARLLRAMQRKSNFPEPLRVAHMVAAALVRGESRGRV